MRNTRLFDRHIIRLSPTEAGEDVRQFLQGLVTQDTAADLPSWAGLLSPKGKALFDCLLWADANDVLIDCESAQTDALIRRLSMYRLRRKIAIAVDPETAVYWSAEGSSDPRHAAFGERWLGAPSAAEGAASASYGAQLLGLGHLQGLYQTGHMETLLLAL